MNFLYGLMLPLRAGQLILRTPRLLFWSALPILIALGLNVWVIMKAQQFLMDWIRSVVGNSGALSVIAMSIAWVGILVVSALTFSAMAMAVAIPFNDLLAEKSERHTQPPLPAAPRVNFLKWVLYLFQDLGKSLFTLPFSVIALLLSWIPGLNLIALALAAFLMSFQFISFPQTRRGQGIRPGLQFLFKNRGACLGFGLSCAALFAIPLLSCIGLPFAVVGGTLLFARFREQSIA